MNESSSPHQLAERVAIVAFAGNEDGAHHTALRDRTPDPGFLAQSERGTEMLGSTKALGEIDRATAPAFAADLHDAIDRSDDAIVSVDCSAVTFMDSAAYRVLVDATNYAVRRGRTLVIRNLSRPCTTLIRLCDMDHELRVEP